MNKQATAAASQEVKDTVIVHEYVEPTDTFLYFFNGVRKQITGTELYAIVQYKQEGRYDELTSENQLLVTIYNHFFDEEPSDLINQWAVAE